MSCWCNSQGGNSSHISINLEGCKLNYCDALPYIDFIIPVHFVYNCLVILTKIMVSCQTEIAASLKTGGGNVFSTFLFPILSTISGIRENRITKYELIQIVSHVLCASSRCESNTQSFLLFKNKISSDILMEEKKYLETSSLNLSFVHSVNKYLLKTYNMSSSVLCAQSWMKHGATLMKLPV